MLEIKSIIADGAFDGLKVLKLASRETCETLFITLEKDAIFPEHSSPRDTLLVMLEGKVVFRINNSEYELNKHQTFKFPAHVKHEVHSKMDSKFLIIR